MRDIKGIEDVGYRGCGFMSRSPNGWHKRRRRERLIVGPALPDAADAPSEQGGTSRPPDLITPVLTLVIWAEAWLLDSSTL